MATLSELYDQVKRRAESAYGRPILDEGYSMYDLAKLEDDAAPDDILSKAGYKSLNWMRGAWGGTPAAADFGGDLKKMAEFHSPGGKWINDPNFGEVYQLNPNVPLRDFGHGQDNDWMADLVKMGILAVGTAGMTGMLPGTTPAWAATAGATAGAGGLTEAQIAEIVAAEGGFSALPSAGMAGTEVAGGLQFTGGALDNIAGNTNFVGANEADLAMLPTQSPGALPPAGNPAATVSQLQQMGLDPMTTTVAEGQGALQNFTGPFQPDIPGGGYDLNTGLPFGTQLPAVGGNLPTIVTPPTGAGGLSDSMSRVINGTATAADLTKLGLTAAGAAALFADNPDRTQTSKIEYPDWYNAGSKSALAQADKFAALGPDSVAPLSANENAAIDMARDSSGVWKPMLDRSGALANEAAGGIPSVDLSSYMNPYLDNVLTPILRRNEIAKASTLNDINARAGMRGAFGGSRNDLLTNQASESADRNMNEIEANVRSGAFTTGLNTAQNDLNRKVFSARQFETLGSATGALTGQDVDRLSSTGATSRAVEQARRNAPLAAIGGYATALRGAPTTTTTTLPEASKIGQATGALATLLGANKAGWL